MKYLFLIILTIFFISCNVETNKVHNIEWVEYTLEEGFKINVPITFDSYHYELTEEWYYDLLKSIYPEWSYDMVIDFHNMPRNEFNYFYQGVLTQEMEDRISYVYNNN